MRIFALRLFVQAEAAVKSRMKFPAGACKKITQGARGSVG